MSTTMRWNISGAPLPFGFPFGAEIRAACAQRDFPPCFLGAIKWNETGNSRDPKQLQYGADPQTMLLPDGSNAGRGPFQLTSSWPENWEDPITSALYAVDDFLLPAVQQIRVQLGLSGDTLVRVAADCYNAGWGQMWAGHLGGDADWLTTGHNYGRRALAAYHSLIAGRMPT